MHYNRQCLEKTQESQTLQHLLDVIYTSGRGYFVTKNVRNKVNSSESWHVGEQGMRLHTVDGRDLRSIRLTFAPSTLRRVVQEGIAFWYLYRVTFNSVLEMVVSLVVCVVRNVQELL